MSLGGLQESKRMPDLMFPSASGELVRNAVGESDQIDAVLIQEPYVAQGRRDLSRVVELCRRSVLHRLARVEEDINGEVGLFLEKSQNEFVES